MTHPNAEYPYVDDAINRVVEMLKDLSAGWTPKVERVSKFIDPALALPSWQLYPGFADPEDRLAAQLTRQTYALNMRLVLGTIDTGYKGVLATHLWLWLPDTLNYFNRRHDLIWDATAQPEQTTPLYLDTANVRIRQSTAYGLFNNSQQIGIEFELLLPFTVSFEPAPGNH